MATSMKLALMGVTWLAVTLAIVGAATWWVVMVLRWLHVDI